MRCRQRRGKPGDVCTVNNSYHYPLPPGLTAGDVVKLVAFDAGYWTVEKDGRTYELFLARVETGFDYEVNGRWINTAALASGRVCA